MSCESEDEELCFRYHSKSKKSYKKGKSQNRCDRYGSPWYHLIGSLERRELAKECVIDYNATEFRPKKIRIKKNGRRCG